MFHMQNITIVLMFTVLLVVIYKNLSVKQKKSHIWRQKSANKALDILKAFKNDGQIVSYLRKLDPFVFEELLLIAIAQNKNCKVIRNSKYTGDGGIDGKFIYTNDDKKKYLYLVQAKRYSAYINNKDILALSKKVKEEKAHQGLFIHTGRSGKDALKIAYHTDNLAIFYGYSDNIKLLSGSKLVDLIKYGFVHE